MQAFFQNFVSTDFCDTSVTMGFVDKQTKV